MQAAIELEREPFPRTTACFEGFLEYGETTLKDGERSLSDLEEDIDRLGRELKRTFLEELINRLPDSEKVVGVEGQDGVLRLHRRDRARKIRTKFGVIEYERTGFSAPESDSLMPKDASLNMPSNGYSFEVQRLVAQEVARGSFDSAAEAIEEQTGLTISKAQLQELAHHTAQDFDAFYKARGKKTAPKGEIVVMSADGKGVVMRQEDLREETRKRAEAGEKKLSKRLSPGEKRNAKRMATVAAVYSIAPFPRTSEDIVGELRSLQEVKKRPKPTNKRVWASLEKDQQEVIEDACREVVRRDRLRKRPLAILVDGNKAQLDCIQEALLQFRLEGTIVIDIIHVIEYLWKAAWCFFPQGASEAQEWVTQQLLRLLEGEALTVIKGLRIKAGKDNLEGSAATTVETVVGYLENNLEYLDYQKCLKEGFPIATGIIEGACRHLVKDRMDITGARWTLATAEAILKLRALRSSGDFEEYWQFFLQQELLRNYRSRIKEILPQKPEKTGLTRVK